MSGWGSQVDFGRLLDRPAFRSDLLYFIRLAGNYAVSIIIDCRQRASGKQKVEFSHWLGLDAGGARRHAPQAATAKELETRLWQQFLRRNPGFVSPVDHRPNIKRENWRALAFGDGWFDIFKTDYPTLLREMPVAMRERLSRALQQDHLLPWKTAEFLTAVEDLTDYRHWLEHPDQRRERGEARPRVDDGRLLEILGLMLLPFLGNHLVGRIRHHERAMGIAASDRCADKATDILRAALATRRDTSLFMNGLKRRVDHDSIRVRLTRRYGNPPGDRAVHRIAKEDAKKRRDLETQKAAMLALHGRYFDEHSWPRYNLENFLMRFAFIGRRRIAALEEKLGIAAEGRPDFINAIEPAFMVAMDMALVIHVWMTSVEAASGAAVGQRKGDTVLTALRNGIAHGDWIWEIADKSRNGQPYSFADLLDALLAFPGKAGLQEEAQWRNDLLTRMEAVLRPCAWPRVYRKAQPGDDPNRLPPPHVVKRWSPATRARFADASVWQREKRTALRRMASSWMRDIAAARAKAF